MKLKVGDQQFEVDFYHHNPKEGKRWTRCEIFTLDTFFGEGNSRCMEGDVYRKASGRKYALEKALQLETREFRKLFWNAYLKVANI